jgi:hypothetical protein
MNTLTQEQRRFLNSVKTIYPFSDKIDYIMMILDDGCYTNAWKRELNQLRKEYIALQWTFDGEVEQNYLPE